MNRIKLILAIAHLFIIAGGLTFYVQPSWISMGTLVAGFFMRWMAPVEEQKKKEEPNIDKFFSSICIGILIGWLSGHGLGEVIEQAIDDRFSLFPLIILTGVLLKIPIQDWLYLRNLNHQEIELYYTKNEA
jgi:hypothetical protein